MLVGCDHGCRYFGPCQQLTVVGGPEVGPNPLGYLVASIRSDFGKTDPPHIWMLRGDLGPDQSNASCSHDSEADRLSRTLSRHLFLLLLSAQFTPVPGADQAPESFCIRCGKLHCLFPASIVGYRPSGSSPRAIIICGAPSAMAMQRRVSSFASRASGLTRN